MAASEAEKDFITYESEDEDGLNDKYDNLPSDEPIESSDGFPTAAEVSWPFLVLS